MAASVTLYSATMRWLIFCFALLLAVACTSTVPTVTPSPSATVPPTSTAQIGINFVTNAPPTQSVLQITPSPLPTATATPSPTPVVYAVADGDTVWSIAYSNRTTPDELMALNPAVRPELLSIGDEIILPPPATAIAQAERGTAVPLAIEVVSVQLYRTPAGSAWIMGEVENRGVVSAENIKLAITLNDNSGNPLGQAEAWVAATNLPAGERAPFGVLLRDFSADSANIATSVIAGNTIVNQGLRYDGLATYDASIVTNDNSAGVTVSGQLSNTGTLSATAAVLVTLLDAADQVSGFTLLTLDEPLVTGDSAEFSISLTPPGAAPVSFRLLVLGQRHTPIVTSNK